MPKTSRTVVILQELSRKVTTRQQQAETHQRAAVERSKLSADQEQSDKELRIAERWGKEAAAQENVALMLASLIESNV
jgi:hypothetical protein